MGNRRILRLNLARNRNTNRHLQGVFNLGLMRVLHIYVAENLHQQALKNIRLMLRSTVSIKKNSNYRYPQEDGGLDRTPKPCLHSICTSPDVMGALELISRVPYTACDAEQTILQVI